MAMSTSSVDLKKDLEELVAIIDEEEREAKHKIDLIFEFCQKSMDKNARLEKIRDYIKREKDIAYITGLNNYNIISDRFFDKIIDIIHKYETEELKTLFYCTFLVLKDMESKNSSNTESIK